MTKRHDPFFDWIELGVDSRNLTHLVTEAANQTGDLRGEILAGLIDDADSFMLRCQAMWDRHEQGDL